MECQKIGRQQERAQQEMLFRFFQAYDEGNPNVLAAILHHAEQDEAFNAELWDVVPIYLVAEAQITREEAFIRFRTLWEQAHRPSARTVAYVAAQMQITIAYTWELSEELRLHLEHVLYALRILVQHEDPLPHELDLSVVQQIFHRYHIDLPAFFQDNFLQTAQCLV